MIKVIKRERESGEKLLKRFSSHVKSCRLPQKFMGLKMIKPPLKKNRVRAAAIMREHYRKLNAQKRFLGV